jgi:hypothetical protein
LQVNAVLYRPRRLMQHVVLPILAASSSTVAGHETLEMEEASPGLWRLLHSPAFVLGVARGDVVRLDDEVPAGFEVRERSGFIAVSVFLPEALGGAINSLASSVQALGGILEGGPKNVAVFSVPVSVGFPAIEKVFTEFSMLHSGVEWVFSNVYGQQGEVMECWVK